MQDKISQIKNQYLEKIQKAKSLKELDAIFLAVFGKTGALTLIPKEFSKLPKDELKIIAPLFIAAKTGLEQEIEKRRLEVKEEGYKLLEKEKLELSGEIQKRQGHLHPSTQFKQEIIELFEKLGFSQFDAPHVEWDKYNFEYLNAPKGHPSRDMWDTLYIDTSDLNVAPGQMLLHTHTSNFWPRLMEQKKGPIMAMSYDRCFRYENIDARHAHTFDQFEIAVVGEGINMSNLKYLSDYMLQAILGKEAKSRFRPKYYPFVEPGVGIDSLCVFCHGKGCKICSGTGWFEIAGAGMIHPNVFKYTGLDPKKYTGLAWGFGPDRMLMLKHKFDDIRYLLEGDLKFLQKF